MYKPTVPSPIEVLPYADYLLLVPLARACHPTPRRCIRRALEVRPVGPSEIALRSHAAVSGGLSGRHRLTSVTLRARTIARRLPLAADPPPPPPDRTASELQWPKRGCAEPPDVPDMPL